MAMDLTEIQRTPIQETLPMVVVESVADGVEILALRRNCMTNPRLVKANCRRMEEWEGDDLRRQTFHNRKDKGKVAAGWIEALGVITQSDLDTNA